MECLLFIVLCLLFVFFVKLQNPEGLVPLVDKMIVATDGDYDCD
jgi:hypothetical protein